MAGKTSNNNPIFWLSGQQQISFFNTLMNNATKTLIFNKCCLRSGQLSKEW
jgi:hypothetical protein